jgi:hypothetical protein
MAATCAWAQEHWEELLDAREASTPLDRAGWDCGFNGVSGLTRSGVVPGEEGVSL